MSEYAIGWLASAKLGWVVLFATAYWLGGRRYKVLRRWGGGVLFPIGIIAFSVLATTYRPWFPLAIVLYPLALSLGYGGETLGEKLRRRALYGLALGGVSILFAWPGALGLWGIQVALAMGASLDLGLTNPVPAAEEEALIAALSVLLVAFMV